MSKTLANLRDALSEAIGDYLHSTVTTALAASNSVVDTTLAEETSRDDVFNRWWCLITSDVNDGVNRKISDYSSTAYTLTIMGAAFASDSSEKATYELHKYNPDNKLKAINAAAMELENVLFRRIEWNDTLIAGNWLPNSHFEDWDSSSYPDYWRVSNATAAEVSTAGLIWGGTSAATVTATTAKGYMYISSDQYPSLLNLMGTTVTLRGWAYPEVLADASMTIYTVQADGTAQTLTSTTTNYAGKWNLLELESQALNDNLEHIEIRLAVATNLKYVHYDNVRLIGQGTIEHLLPTDFQTGNVSSVYLQTSGRSEFICDDQTTSISQVSPLYGWTITDKAGTKYLRLPRPFSSEVKLILVGDSSLESNLSADTDTMTISDPYTNLLIAYAAYILFEREAGLPSAQDRDFLREEAAYWLGKAEFLKKKLRMVKKQPQTRFIGVE